jgi:uncharacterized membrane protein YecN with MAPEG domain
MLKAHLWTALATLAALGMYFFTILRVGGARGKYKIPAPATTGNPDFERVLRVQQNTTEQLVFFIPALWLFSFYTSPLWAGILGALWVVARVIYAIGYYAEAKKRAAGFGLSTLASLSLWVGAIVGAVLAFLRG